MATGSLHNLFNNQTQAFQIFYDWTRSAQVINLMREDSITYTIMHNGTNCMVMLIDLTSIFVQLFVQ